MASNAFEDWRRAAIRETIGHCHCGGNITVFSQPYGQYPSQEPARQCVCTTCGLLYDEAIARQRQSENG